MHAVIVRWKRESKTHVSLSH